MVGGPVAERIHICLEIVRVQSLSLQSANQEIRQVNALGSRGHFKPILDQIKSSTGYSIRIRHGVERFQLQGPIDHEEGLLPHKSSEFSLLGLRKIHPVLYLFAVLPKLVHRLRVLNSL